MSTKTRNYVHDYYSIALPADLFVEGNDEAICAMAIEQAREQSKLYCIPCEWMVMSIVKGAFYHTVKVRRRRRKVAKQ